jgi:hypothetical protein
VLDDLAGPAESVFLAGFESPDESELDEAGFLSAAGDLSAELDESVEEPLRDLSLDPFEDERLSLR